jgi:hypothetical protein
MQEAVLSHVACVALLKLCCSTQVHTDAYYLLHTHTRMYCTLLTSTRVERWIVFDGECYAAAVLRPLRVQQLFPTVLSHICSVKRTSLN